MCIARTLFRVYKLLVLFLALTLPYPLPAAQRRSTAAKNAFKKGHPCPANGKTAGACPGYVIDHVFPLACGGPDASENMQWQTRKDAHEKDLWELTMDGCPAKFRTPKRLNAWERLRRKLKTGDKVN